MLSIYFLVSESFIYIHSCAKNSYQARKVLGLQVKTGIQMPEKECLKTLL
jgi:hypothetical protein